MPGQVPYGNLQESYIHFSEYEEMVKKSSRKMTEGVPDFSVIHKGNLKGFVSICPGWGGIDGSALLEICQEVYEEEELEELNHKIRIWSGEEQGKVVSMALSGYQVPHGIYFLNKSLPALTVGRRRIKFSKACHEKLNYCRWVEILYHPIIQTIIIRQTTPDNPNCIEWEKEDGNGVMVYDVLWPFIGTMVVGDGLNKRFRTFYEKGNAKSGNKSFKY